MPCGRQLAEGRSAIKFACRCLYNSAAAGSRGGIVSPGRMKSARLGPIAKPAEFTRCTTLRLRCHKPVRFGFPSADFGTGALRSGLPSDVRGIPGVGYLIHCAEAVAAQIVAARQIRRIIQALIVAGIFAASKPAVSIIEVCGRGLPDSPGWYWDSIFW